MKGKILKIYSIAHNYYTYLILNIVNNKRKEGKVQVYSILKLLNKSYKVKMKNKKILIIISFILIALFIIMGKMLFDITKENSNNNVKLIEVKGFVASKKQDDIMIILEDNETNVNSLQIKNTGFEINDSVTLKIENRTIRFK